MAFFTNAYLNKRRKQVLRSIVKFSYQKDNGSWFNDATIDSKEIVGTDVLIFATVPSSGSANTITRVRLYDDENEIAGEGAVSIVRTGENSAGIRFTVPLIEQQS